jgi:hypothetical protein
MAVDVAGNIAYLEEVLALAGKGAPAVARRMAEYIAERTASDTLTRKRLSPGMYHRAKPGDPPAMMSGKLADSMFTEMEPAGSFLRASAYVGSEDKRARMFEHGGCVLKPGRAKMLHWRDTGRPDNPGGWWSHEFLTVDVEHPFLGPTTEEAIDDGDLQRIAVEEFRKYDP